MYCRNSKLTLLLKNKSNAMLLSCKIITSLSLNIDVYTLKYMSMSLVPLLEPYPMVSSNPNYPPNTKVSFNANPM